MKIFNPFSIVVEIIYFVMALALFPTMEDFHRPQLWPHIKELWISSPSGKTKLKLPRNQALRICRKQGWYIEPLEPREEITKGQALKILFKKRR